MKYINAMYIYICLLLGSIMTDIQNFFKKKKSTRTRKK